MKAEIHQNQQTNKDWQAVQEIEERLSSGKRVSKTHIRAKLNSNDSQKDCNSTILGMYHVIVNKVKELYSILPNAEDRIIILLNNRLDPTDCQGLFTLITPTFFFYLECDILSNYRVEYMFDQCPVEAEVKQLIDQFSMRSFSTEVVNQPNYPAFFQRCLQVQPSRFIHQL